MTRLKKILVLGLTVACSACSSPTRIYYWERPNTGGEHFVRDHNRCLQKADWFPFETFNVFSLSPETRNLTLNLKEGGIWGNFAPYKGAMPIFVNNAHPSKTLIYFLYSSCMKKAGYTERRPFGGPLE